MKNSWNWFWFLFPLESCYILWWLAWNDFHLITWSNEQFWVDSKVGGDEHIGWGKIKPATKSWVSSRPRAPCVVQGPNMGPHQFRSSPNRATGPFVRHLSLCGLCFSSLHGKELLEHGQSPPCSAGGRQAQCPRIGDFWVLTWCVAG